MKTAVFLTFRVQNRMGQNMGQPLTHPLTHTRKNSCGTNGIRQGNPTGFRFPFAFFLSVGHAPFFVYSGADFDRYKIMKNSCYKSLTMSSKIGGFCLLSSFTGSVH